MIKIKIIFIFTILLILNIKISYQSQQIISPTTIQQTIIDIYLDDTWGNDNNNGTYEYPYKSICKGLEVINQSVIVNNNNEINFNLYLNNNARFINDICDDLIIVNKNINFLNYTSYHNNNNSIRIILKPNFTNLNFIIINSNISINCTDFSYYGSKKKQFKIISTNLNYYYGDFIFIDVSVPQFNESNLHFNNVQFLSDLYKSQEISFISSIIDIDSLTFGSSIINFQDCISTDLKNVILEKGSINLIKNNKLLFYNSFIDTVDIIFQENQNQSIEFQNSLFSYSNSITTLFSLYNQNSISIFNCEIQSIGLTFNNIFNSSNADITIQNTLIVGFRLLNGIVSMYNSDINIKNLTLNYIDSKVYIYSRQSNLILDQIQFGAYYDGPSSQISEIIIDLVEPSNVTIENSKLSFQGYIILSTYSGFNILKKSNITINNSTFLDIQGFEFLYSNINFINVKITTQNNLKNVFQLDDQCEFYCKDCLLSSSSLLGSTYLFYAYKSSIINLQSTTILKSSNIIQLKGFSHLFLNECYLTSIYSTNLETIYLSNSILHMENTTVENVYTVDKSFIKSENSDLYLKKNKFYSTTVSDTLISTISSNLTALENEFHSIVFQSNLFDFDDSRIQMDFSDLQNIISFKNYANSIFFIKGFSHFQMNNSFYIDNYVDSFFNCTDHSYVELVESYLDYNSGTFLISSSNVMVQIIKSLFESLSFGVFNSLFYFQDSLVILDYITLSGGIFIGGALESYNSNVFIMNSHFVSNSIFGNSNRRDSFMYFKNSKISISDTLMDYNNQWSENFIEVVSSNFTMKNCNFTHIEIQSVGNLINMKSTISNFQQNYFFNVSSNNGSLFGFFDNSSNQLVSNSIFVNRNFQGEGGVAYFDKNSTGQFFDNLFLANYAPVGGVIFTEDYFNISLFENNTFQGNRAVYGNNYAGFPQNIVVGFPNNDKYPSDTINNFYIYDFYGNLVSNVNYIANVSIKLVYINETISQPNYLPPINIRGGTGSFNYSYNAPYFVDHFLVSIIIPDNSKLDLIDIQKNKSKCIQYHQFYNNVTQECQYCQFNQLSVNGKECLQCPKNLVCQDSFIFAINDYYLIVNENRSAINNNLNSIFNVYQCPIGICKTSNQCYSNLANGNLCSKCQSDDHNGISISKNGLHCCKNFKTSLFIVYLIFLIGFSLILSFFKFNLLNNNLLTSIILMLQLNSIIFYNYQGLYILPLFRFSVDFIFNYCTLKLNYLFKFYIQISSIIVCYLIGISNLSTNILIWFYNNRKLNFVSRKLLSDKFISNQIKQLKYNHKNNKQFWNVFLILVQPLLFNLISIIIPKSIENQNYLLYDISIEFYSNNQHFITFIITIILLFSLIILLPIYLLLNIYYNRINFNNRLLNNNNNNNNNGLIIIRKSIYQSFKKYHHYRTNFRWWDFIVIFKNFIIILLSIILLYTPNYYLFSIIFILMIFSISQFVLHPQLTRKSYFLENCINISQTLILILFDSNLFKNIINSNYKFGLIYSIYNLFIIFLLIFLNYYYFSTKKK